MVIQTPNNDVTPSYTLVTAACMVQLLNSTMKKLTGDTLSKVYTDNDSLNLLIANTFEYNT